MKLKRMASAILSLAMLSSLSFTVARADNDNVFYENFENMATGKFPSKIGGQVVNYYQAAANNPQNVFEVQEDEFGSKALKMVVNTKTANSSTTFRIPIGQNLRSGVYEFSFDMRAENNSRYFSRFFQLWNEKDQSEIWGETSGDNIYLLGKSENPTAIFNMKNHDKESYFRVKFIFNMNTRKYRAYVNDNSIGGETSLPRKVNSSECGLSQIVIYLNNGNLNGTDKDGSDVNPGVYWIDNIVIKKNVATVTQKSPEDKSIDADPEKPAEITLNYELDEATVNTDNVSVYENDELLDKDAYIVSTDKNKVGVEKTAGGFEYNKSYRIEFSEKIAIKDAVAEIKPGMMDIQFKTQSVIPDVLKDGGHYSKGYDIVIPEKENIEYKIFLINADVENEYQGGGLEIGEYKVKVLATNTKNGKTEEKIYSVSVVGPYPPTAENVKIEGVPGTGETLKVTFDYTDVNGDLPGTHKYVWMKSSNPNGGFKPIEGATQDSYTLREEDENCYIKAVVTPVTDVEPFEGEEAESEAFEGSFSPVATDIKVEGTVKVGEVLTGSYKYFDENGDKETETMLLWVKDSKPDGEFSESLKNQNGNSCTVGEEDINCYIKLAVIPKNDGKSKQDDRFLSDALLAPFAPEAREVKIMGEARVGQAIGASYSFYDLNGDSEGESIIEWFVDGVSVATAEKLTLSEGYNGKTVSFKVTPVSKEMPYEGEVIESETLRVAEKRKTTFSGGGGGGGGGSTVAVVTPPATDKTDNKDDTVNNDNGKTGFSDTNGHWAESAISLLSEKGIINGMGDGSFNPEGRITRAQLAAIISKILDGEMATASFSDVSEGAWYYEAVTKVNALGIMKGDGGSFRPEDYVKREEIAVTISNILKLKNITITAEGVEVPDADEISGWAKEGVENCIKLGIITGYEDGSFKAKNQATRAQIAVITEKLLKVLEGDADEK